MSRPESLPLESVPATGSSVSNFSQGSLQEHHSDRVSMTEPGDWVKLEDDSSEGKRVGHRSSSRLLAYPNANGDWDTGSWFNVSCSQSVNGSAGASPEDRPVDDGKEEQVEQNEKDNVSNKEEGIDERTDFDLQNILKSRDWEEETKASEKELENATKLKLELLRSKSLPLNSTRRPRGSSRHLGESLSFPASGTGSDGEGKRTKPRKSFSDQAGWFEDLIAELEAGDSDRMSISNTKAQGAQEESAPETASQ